MLQKHDEMVVRGDPRNTKIFVALTVDAYQSTGLDIRNTVELPRKFSRNFVSRGDKYVVPLLEGDISNAPRSVRNATQCSLRSLGIAR